MAGTEDMDSGEEQHLTGEHVGKVTLLAESPDSPRSYSSRSDRVT